VDPILIHSLTNCGPDVHHDHLRDNNNFVKDKAHVGEPDLRESDEEDSVWINSCNLAVPDISKVQGQKSLFDVSNGGCGPEEFKYDTLPNLFFKWTIKKEMASIFITRQADRTEGGLEDGRHHVV
jgi:hypothetical protein